MGQYGELRLCRTMAAHAAEQFPRIFVLELSVTNPVGVAREENERNRIRERYRCTIDGLTLSPPPGNVCNDALFVLGQLVAGPSKEVIVNELSA